MAGSFGRSGRFSRQEIVHLVASMAALTVAFLFVLPEGFGAAFEGELPPFGEVLQVKFLGTAVAVVGTAFLLHELAHKFVAQTYGHWSEYRAHFGQLSIAVFVGAAFGVLFAAPGVVNIMGNVDESENGVISAVGPLTNIAMAAVFLVLLQAYLTDPFWGFVFEKGAFFNILLAAFNMAPFGRLDGSKIVSWNVGIYLFLVLLIVFELVVLFPSLLGGVS